MRRKQILRMALLLVIMAWLMVGLTVAQEQEPITLAVTWSDVTTKPVSQASDAEEWHLMFQYQLRAEETGATWQTEVITSTCRPVLGDPPEGDCSLDSTWDWDTSEMPSGVYDSLVQVQWTNGDIDEIVYVPISGALGVGNHWYLLNKIEVGYLQLPLQIEVR